MARKRYTAEQIIGNQRQAEIILGHGEDLDQILLLIATTHVVLP